MTDVGSDFDELTVAGLGLRTGTIEYLAVLMGRPGSAHCPVHACFDWARRPDTRMKLSCGAVAFSCASFAI